MNSKAILCSKYERNPEFFFKNNSKGFIYPVTDDLSTTTPAPKLQNGTTGWELALVTAPSSNESSIAANKLVFPHLYQCVYIYSPCGIHTSNGSPPVNTPLLLLTEYG